MLWLRAFLLGMREYRLSLTTHFDTPALVDAYDRGRDLAHRLTMRRHEQ